LEALAYIRRDNPLAASKFREKAERLLRRPDEYPESGRLIPEFPDLPHREVVVSPYQFFYRVEKGTVWIVAVWHGAQEATEPS
jgi:toxin ParE1/3/4